MLPLPPPNVRPPLLYSDRRCVDHAPQYERPWCLIELVTAIEHGIPIVAVTLTSGAFAYDFAAASAYLESLDTELEARSPGLIKGANACGNQIAAK